MKRSELLLRDSRRYSLMMLLCATAAIISICGALTGIQDESGFTLTISVIVTGLLVIAAVNNGIEAWRLLGLWEREVGFERESNNGGKIE
jgi:hypothetical protein